MAALRSALILTRLRPVNTVRRVAASSLFRTGQSTRTFSSTTFRHAERRYVRFDDNPGPGINFKQYDIRTLALAGVGLGGLVYYITQCVGPSFLPIRSVLIDLYHIRSLEQVPETGRWRFMDVSPKLETKVGHAVLPSQSIPC